MLWLWLIDIMKVMWPHIVNLCQQNMVSIYNEVIPSPCYIFDAESEIKPTELVSTIDVI